MLSNDFSITTDLADPSTDVTREIAAFASAGFRYAHWCQNWAWKPVFYDAEFSQAIDKLQKANGVQIQDVHGFSGTAEGLTYTDELFLATNINRLEFCRRIGADVLVIHLPLRKYERGQDSVENALKMIAALEPASRAAGVRLAVENLNYPPQCDDFLDRIFERFGPDVVGFCYDSGHALLENRVEYIERYGRRLIATHLHDNDGTDDQHRLPGEGKVDWPRVLRAIRAANYSRPMNLELFLPPNTRLEDFCQRAFGVIRDLLRRHSSDAT